MRENRPYGSEGGAARKGRSYPYPGLGPPAASRLGCRRAECNSAIPGELGAAVGSGESGG